MKPVNSSRKEFTYKGNLHLNLNVPYKFAGNLIDKAEFLRTNGIAEEVFLKKLPEKPYTWIANVLTIAIGNLGGVQVGTIARNTYEKSGIVMIPPVINAMPLAEANSFLPEVHRRVWKNTIPNQEILCKYCGQKAIVDIELDKMELSKEDKELIEATPEFDLLYVDLEVPLVLDSWLKELKKENDYGNLMGVSFNRLVFRIPTLGDAIMHERFATTDGIKFWRKIAFTCLQGIQSVDSTNNEDGELISSKIVNEVPNDIFVWLGEKLMNKFLDSEDLAQIRFAMREELPTLPFAYRDSCPSCNRETPFAMEASSFFSE